VARPTTGVRSLAGFTLGEPLGRDIYGEVHQATGEGRRDVRLLVVEPRLAADEAFGDALSRGTAPLLGSFKHRAVVPTIVVARDGKSLVVVTEGVAGGTALADVLARARARGGKAPTRVAAAICRAVIDGLADAHLAGIVHGAVHPRSVLIARDGTVRLTDFAVGFAAMSAAAAGSEAMPLKGLAGYLAPELALGDSPTPAADVYAVGALLYTMLTGETPPGSLNTSPAVERLVQRALDTDLARRFGDGIALQENFVEALEDDRWEVATPAEVARFVDEVGADGPEPNLDAATEDLLASLDGSLDVTRPPSDDLIRPVTGSGKIDSVLSELEDAPELSDPSIDGPHTVVDELLGQAGRDPISELLALEADQLPTNIVEPGGGRPLETASDEHTPLPPPQPDEPGTLTREGSDLRPAPRRPEPAPAPSRLVEATRPKGQPAPSAPSAAADEADDEDAAPAPAREATPAPAPARRFVRPADDVEPVEPPALKRSPVWAWLGLAAVLAGGGLLFWKIRKNADAIGEGEQAAKAARDKKDRENAELERRLRAEQADPGTIVITSQPEGGAVWLLLGRTPFDSIPLATDNVWEMRVELEGYLPQDVRVGGSGWSGPKEDRKASIDVKLDIGTPAKPLPAIPAAPPASDTAGLSEGSGTLHAVSNPPGAAVWLLVGQTNKMALAGIEAGRDYELKVVKDGFLPGFVRIAAEEWRYGGDPRLPLSAAPKRETIERPVELVPQPPARK